jgi:putative transposase
MGRVVLPHYPHHIVQRGHNRTACFFAEDDYGFYLHHLDQLATELDPEAIQEIRDSTNGGYALGDSRFKEQLQAMVGRRVVRGKAGRPAGDVQPHGAGQQGLFEGGE